MANFVSCRGVIAVKIRCVFAWQPLYDCCLGIAVWQTIANPDGGDSASVVILWNVLTKHHYQIRPIK